MYPSGTFLNTAVRANSIGFLPRVEATRDLPANKES